MSVGGPPCVATVIDAARLCRVVLASAMDEEEAELRNPFPSPPSHYVNYTNHNLALLALLKERTADVDPSTNEQQILSDQTGVPPWSLLQLEKPRLDWIVEEGHYNVFGDTWFVRL